jgi:hypothetical protein
MRLACGLLLLACVSACSSSHSRPTTGGNGGSSGDAGVAAPCGDGYHDPATPSCWLGHTVKGADTFRGATFDGRYVYFTPDQLSTAARLDTQAPFDSESAWTTFDVTSGKGGTATNFAGAAFDGRYVYLIPSLNTVVVRFDTHGSFTDAAAWSQFETAQLTSTTLGFGGATFDGRYLYLIPDNGADLVRYDTQADFATASSWKAQFLPLDVTNGFFGGVFDGRYVYLLPGQSKAGGDIVVGRYDTQAPIDQPASWASFDLTRVSPSPGGFSGGVFDGRYVYLVPRIYFGLLADDYAVVWRYDTQAPFTMASAWSQFDTHTLPGAPVGFYSGGAFDGRRVYFLPGDPRSDSMLVSYDIQGDFATASSWSTFNAGLPYSNGITTVRGPYSSSCFDGRYLYLTPNQLGAIGRIDAKTPAALPDLPAFHGSFF